MDHDAHAQVPAAPAGRSSSEGVDRGVVGWMLRVGQLLANRHRLAIVLALAELDTGAQELQSLLAIDASSVYRHLQALRRAGLVLDHVTGFGRGPPRVFALTGAGRQLVEALRGVAQQIVRATPLKAEKSAVTSTGSPAPRPGLVKVDRGALMGVLESVSDYHHWRLLHGLLDEEAYVVAVRRLHQLAQDAGVGFAAIQEQGRRPAGSGGGHR